MNRKGFSTLEMLIILVIASVVLIGGLLIAFGAKKKGEMNTFQNTATEIIVSAKQSYNNFKKAESSYIINNGDTKGMCITLNGLVKNELYNSDIKDLTGYVIIEEKNDNITYTLWLYNKKFIIKGIDGELVQNEKKEKVVKDYNNEDIEEDIKGSFKGIYGTYNGTCINDKI